MVLLVVGALVVGVIAAVGGAVANQERIDRMWVSATLDPNGGPTVIHEVIDYNFGTSSNRHGLARRVPGLTTDATIHVSSPDAPAGIAAVIPLDVGGVPGVEIRVGDPNQTVSGPHRYVLDYTLATVDDGHRLAWDAVGTGWAVGIGKVEINVVAPYDLTSLQCQSGAAGSTAACAIDQAAPGRLFADVNSVSKGHGVTIRAVRGGALAAIPTPPAPPAQRPADPGARPGQAGGGRAHRRPAGRPRDLPARAPGRPRARRRRRCRRRGLGGWGDEHLRGAHGRQGPGGDGHH